LKAELHDFRQKYVWLMRHHLPSRLTQVIESEDRPNILDVFRRHWRRARFTANEFDYERPALKAYSRALGIGMRIDAAIPSTSRQ